MDRVGDAFPFHGLVHRQALVAGHEGWVRGHGSGGRCWRAAVTGPYQTVMKASPTPGGALSSIRFISGEKGRPAAVPALQAWIEGGKMIKTFTGLQMAARFPVASLCVAVAAACVLAGCDAS